MKLLSALTLNWTLSPTRVIRLFLDCTRFYCTCREMDVSVGPGGVRSGFCGGLLFKDYYYWPHRVRLFWAIFESDRWVCRYWYWFWRWRVWSCHGLCDWKIRVQSGCANHYLWNHGTNRRFAIPLGYWICPWVKPTVLPSCCPTWNWENL